MANGTQSELTDNGVTQTLAIANSLVVGQTGFLNLYGGTAVTAGADSSNAGQIVLTNASSISITGNLDNSGYLYAAGGGLQVQIGGTLTNEAGSNLTLAGGNSANIGSLNNMGYLFVGPNSFLNLVNQPGGMTDVLPTAQVWIQGTVTDIANNANGFANLQSIEGDLFFQNGRTTTITPGNGTLAISITGQFDVSTVNGVGTTVNVNGNVDSAGYVNTSRWESFYGNYGGGNILNVSGTYTNELNGGQLILNGNYYHPDVVNVGSLDNQGYVFVGPNSYLNLLHQPGGITTVSGSSAGVSQFWIQGTVTDVVNGTNAFANLQSVFGNLYFQNGQTTTITPPNGTLLIGNPGQFDVSTINGTGTTVNINGNVDSSSYVATSHWESFYGNYGGGNILNVSGTYTNELNGGQLILNGNYYHPDVVNVGSLDNQGYVFVGPNSFLNLVNQPGGITDVVANSQFELYGSFTAGGNHGFANLNSIEGTVNLYGQSFTINPGGGTLTNTGTFNIDANPMTTTGSAITINGNVNNSGTLTTGQNNGVSGGNTLIINGNFTNNGGFGEADFQGDHVTANTLTNNGWLQVGRNSTLTILNQPNGITDVVAGSGFYVSGSFTTGGNPAFANLNSVEGFLGLYDQTFNITPGSGTFSVSPTAYINFDSISGSGSNITIFGNVNSSGFLGLNDMFGNGPSTLTVTGNVTVNPGGYFDPADGQVTVPTLINDGHVYIGPHGSLTLTNQPGGITDVVQGSLYWVAGTFNAGSNSALAGLTSVEGTLVIGGHTASVTPSGGTFLISNTGNVDTSYATLTINGNVNNSGFLSTGYWGGTGNQLNITGTLTNNPGSTFNMYASGDMASMASLLNQGSINIGPGATLDPLMVNNFATINVNGTMLVGTGTPGAPGYYQFANGTLGEHIDASQFGVIVVGPNGSVDLNGTLDIQLATGFDPTVGSTYQIVTFTPGDLTGSFASILNSVFNNGTEKWVLLYSNSGGYVELMAQNNSPVPEPSSFLLLGGGLLGIAGLLRRKLLA